MNKPHSRLLTAAALALASLAVSAQERQVPAQSAIGLEIATQGNAALLSIRSELALNLKQSLALQRLVATPEFVQREAAPAALTAGLRVALNP